MYNQYLHATNYCNQTLAGEVLAGIPAANAAVCSEIIAARAQGNAESEEQRAGCYSGIPIELGLDPVWECYWDEASSAEDETVISIWRDINLCDQAPLYAQLTAEPASTQAACGVLIAATAEPDAPSVTVEQNNACFGPISAEVGAADDKKCYWNENSEETMYNSWVAAHPDWSEHDGSEEGQTGSWCSWTQCTDSYDTRDSSEGVEFCHADKSNCEVTCAQQEGGASAQWCGESTEDLTAGCPSMCSSEEAAQCVEECAPCLTNFDGTTTSGEACSTCASCAAYAVCTGGPCSEEALSEDSAAIIGYCCSEPIQAELTAAGTRCGPVDANGEPVDVQAADFDQSLWTSGAINPQCFACWNEESNSLDVEQAGCADAKDANGNACNDPEGFCVKFANENQAADCWTPEINAACSLTPSDYSGEDEHNALIEAAGTAAVLTMGLNGDQLLALGTLLTNLPEDSPLAQLMGTAVQGAFGENGTPPTLEALTATLKTVFTSAAFSTLLGSTEGVDADLIASVKTVSEGAAAAETAFKPIADFLLNELKLDAATVSTVVQRLTALLASDVDPTSADFDLGALMKDSAMTTALKAAGLDDDQLSSLSASIETQPETIDVSGSAGLLLSSMVAVAAVAVAVALV